MFESNIGHLDSKTTLTVYKKMDLLNLMVVILVCDGWQVMTKACIAFVTKNHNHRVNFQLFVTILVHFSSVVSKYCSHKVKEIQKDN
jgi:hypothetical protein